MYNSRPLKRVIDGKSYNTDTATLLHEHVEEDELQENGPHGPNPYPFYQQLYRTRYGKFFLALRNESFLNHATGENDLLDRIVPVEIDRAVKWMELYCNEKIEQFVDVPEAGDPSTTLTLRMDKALKSSLNTASIAEGISMNVWCVRALESVSKVWNAETNVVPLAIPKIPHGHGLSFKKGLAEGLLGSNEHLDGIHETHTASYHRGHAVGFLLRGDIAKLVKS
jgi:hypothetical protein